MGSTQIPQLEKIILERIREALEIKKAKYSKKIKVLNIDEGNLVKTNTWAPLLANINDMLTF